VELSDRYLVISADCHAGASMDTYREYLTSSLHDDYDAWRADFVNPFADLRDTESIEYRRNFDASVRQGDLEADGVAAEVLFPNTIPPFYPAGMPFNPPSPKTADELERRWAGIHAHNRWLADFSAELPGRRAGIAQIFLDDVERAVEEVRWVAQQPGLFGGIMLPNPPVDSTTPQLHSPDYESLWTACEDLGVVVNSHGGGGGPLDYGPFDTSLVMMYLEFGWYCQRPLTRLIFSGVLERHPNLTFVMTETGNSWVPGALDELDFMYNRIMNAHSGAIEGLFGGIIRDRVLRQPSEYWARQCYIGASFLSRRDSKTRYATGIDRVMWGSDYPHREGTFPNTNETLRYVFHDVAPEEVAMILGENAARAYRFDVDALRPVADRIGPTVADLSRELRADELPADAITMALPLGGSA
jgi:predicted TIM-barrel fold metal-dependent hydrolase